MGGNQSIQTQYGVWVGEEKPGETRVLRNPKIGEGPLESELESGVDTILKAFEVALLKYPNKRFLGTRKMISKDKFGDYEWKTYQEIGKLARDFAVGADLLKLCPEITTPNAGLFKFLGIYSKNREEWIVADIASQMNSVTVVTFYDTLGDSTIQYILDQTHLTTLVLEGKVLHKIIALKGEKKSCDLKNLILLDMDDQSLVDKAVQLGLNVYTYREVLKAGIGSSSILTPCTPDTIATFCYTSGTTGTPKGAMIHHRGIIADATLLTTAGISVTGSDVMLSYLPLAHVFERLVFSLIMYNGITVGFYCGNPQKIVEDCQILKPTILCGVPRIFQRIYEAITSKMKNMGLLSKLMVERAIKAKIQAYRSTGAITHSVWDPLVFNKTKYILGGKMRLMISASAPIASDVLEFLKICFCCLIVEGYGQTETCGGVSITHIDDTFIGHVGGIFPCCEIKLIDHPEMNYTSKDINPDTGLPEPRGEICVRGPLLFKGYFNDSINTQKTYTNDGWLLSGDVGAILPQQGNALKIIDRVKNILKLSQGEYIAPEKIENILVKSKYVSQIFVHGESLYSYLVAVIVPKLDDCIEFLTQKGIHVTRETASEYYEDPDLLAEIVKDMDSLGRKYDLKGFEVIKKVYLSRDVFSMENNMLTPTMKLKRYEAKKRYIEEIKRLYESESKA